MINTYQLKEFIDEHISISDGKSVEFLGVIVNHSKNPKDLIQEGDYVNGYRVIEVTEHTFTTMEQGGYKVHHKECVTIKSIVTKEQYKSVEYVF